MPLSPRLRSALLLLLALPLVAGCQKESAPVGGERLQIAVIPKGTTHEFWKSIHAGAAKAADELGVDIIWQGPHKEDDRQMQIQVVQNFVSQDVDAIVLAPLDARSLARPVETAAQRQIPVVIIDSGLESEAHLSFVATDNYAGGQLAADRLAEVLGGKGKVILLRYQEGSASTHAREEGFMARMAEVAPGIEVVSSNLYAGATMEKALQVSQNLLNRYADVDGIFTPNETSTQGMLRALQTSGRAGQIKHVGFDANDALVEALQAGQIHGLVLQDPFTMGYLGVKTAVAAIKGEPYEREVDTRLMMVTPENMETEDARTLLHPDIAKWLDE